MWSSIADSDFSSLPQTDEEPVAIMVSKDGTNPNVVAVVSKLQTTSGGQDVVIRAYDMYDGSYRMKPVFYTSSGVATDVPAGLTINGNIVAVGGSGPNSTSGRDDMFVLACNIDDIQVGSNYFPSGTLFGPTFKSSGSSRDFLATCMTVSPTAQDAPHNSAYFTVAGRSHATSTPTNGDWFVVGWNMGINSSTGAPTFTDLWSGTGKSTPSWDDVPVTMCLGSTLSNYVDPGDDPIPNYFRLWVSGNRVPTSGGKSQITTVQFAFAAPIGGSAGDIEWYNHYSYDEEGDRNAMVAAIGAMDLSSGRDTLAYVAGWVERPGGSTNFLMLKYTPNPIGDFSKNNNWNPTTNTGYILAASGDQVSAANMPIRTSSPAYDPGRMILLAGTTSGNMLDIRPIRFTDSND